MKEWYREYRRLLRRTRAISVVGPILLILMILGELMALQFAISVHEQPRLPDDIWWDVCNTVVFAGLLVGILTFRAVLLFRENQKEWLNLTAWLVCAALFVAYFVFMVESPSTNACSPDGTCFQIYSIQRTDRIGLAAIVFFLGSLVRFFVTAVWAQLNLSSKLQ